MVYSSRSAAFRRDKQQFFTSIPQDGSIIEFAEEYAQNKDYTYLLKNKQAMEAEFSQMFAVLQKEKKKGENDQAFWLYCYYCASLLEAYYKAYGQQLKASEFSQFKVKIKARLQNVEAQAAVDNEEQFIESLRKKFIDNIKSLASSPNHIAQIRDNVAFTNLCRLYWVFCRLTLVQGFRVAKEFELLDQLDKILGTHTDIDKIISVIQAPNGVLNYFSVGLFLFRLMVDGGLLIKHTFFPSRLEKGAAQGTSLYQLNQLPKDDELNGFRGDYIILPSEMEGDQPNLYYVPHIGRPLKLKFRNHQAFLADGLELINLFNENQISVHLSPAMIQDFITQKTGHVPEVTTRLDRFKQEWHKRHCNFANDAVWATINFLTNFNHISKIPSAYTGYVTAAFLIFDISLLLYRCHLARQEYMTKKSQYRKEKEDYNNPDLFQNLSEAQRRAHIDLLDKQLIELEISFRTTEASFHFAALAATLLFLGFTTTLLVTPAAIIFASYFVCQVAVAMYLSTGVYGQFTEKSLRLEQALLHDDHVAAATKDYELARNEFIFSMVKNTVIPTILITTFAVCWPAALVLTAMYLGYETYHAYTQHSGSKEVKALTAEENDLVPAF